MSQHWSSGSPPPAVRGGSGEDASIRRNGSADLSSQLLRTAARRVEALLCAEVGSAAATPREITELLRALTTAMRRWSVSPGGPLADRLATPLGRRLLDLLRAELVQRWSGNGNVETTMLPLLRSLEQVREALEPQGAQHPLAGLCGPQGLDILVDMAHDLRSPLTSILFLAETLQRGHSGEVNEVQRRQLGLVYSAALGLSSMASDIIELARGGDQLVEKEPVSFSVGAVLESVHDIVRPIAEEKRLSVRLTALAQDQRMGHPVALSRVLLNLTTNALKYTDRGCVRITARKVGPARVQFAVSDSGQGIDPAIVETLYRPLKQSGRLGPAFSQAGLGLSMCRRLTEAMGSELRVAARPGRGTRFFFELDLPPCGTQAHGTARGTPTPARRARRSSDRRPTLRS